MKRRDIIIGAGCAAAAGAAYCLRPRNNISLLGKRQLTDIVPTSFGPWQAQDVADPLAINSEGSLSARLYNQLVVRVYRDASTSAEVLMLLAHGARQTDELQLHRPEVCYPAFGYTLTHNERIEIPIGPGVHIPARRLLAVGETSTEGVIYWSRMGEQLPASAGEQRRDRLQIAMQGIIPDGLLSRFSMVAQDPARSWIELQTFVSALLHAVSPQDRSVLIGTSRARAVGQRAA